MGVTVGATVGVTVGQPFTEKRQPTPAQEGEWERTRGPCRRLDHGALEQRSTAWQRCQAAVARAQQAAELKAIPAELPASARIHSPGFQHVLARLEKPSQACFPRVQVGETPGGPRFKGRARDHRDHRCTVKADDNGATLANGFLVLATRGRSAVRWSRPRAGPPKTVSLRQDAAGWSAGCAGADVPVRPLPLPTTGQETGRDLGLESCAPWAAGRQSAHPRLFRVAELAVRRAQRRGARRQPGRHRRRTAGQLLAQAQQRVPRPRPDLHPTPALALALVRQHDTRDHADPAAGQPAQEAPVRQEPRAGRVGPVPLPPVLQRGSRWEDRGRRAGGVPRASLCGLRRHPPDGALRPVASLLCPEGGTRLHRDHTAARTSLRVGQDRRAGQAPQAST